MTCQHVTHVVKPCLHWRVCALHSFEKCSGFFLGKYFTEVNIFFHPYLVVSLVLTLCSFFHFFVQFTQGTKDVTPRLGDWFEGVKASLGVAAGGDVHTSCLELYSLFVHEVQPTEADHRVVEPQGVLCSAASEALDRLFDALVQTGVRTVIVWLRPDAGMGGQEERMDIVCLEAPDCR